MSPHRWGPTGHLGPLAPLAFPGDAPGRQSLQKIEGLLRNITWEEFERMPLASWTRSSWFRSQQQLLGDRGDTAIPTTRSCCPCQGWLLPLIISCTPLVCPGRRAKQSLSWECSPSTRCLNNLQRANIELAPFQALWHPGSVNNSPTERVSWEKRLFMSIPQAPLPQKPSNMILSQLL